MSDTKTDAAKGSDGSGAEAKPRTRRSFGRRLARVFVGILSGFLILAIIGAGVAFYAFWYYGKDLPNYEKLANYEPPIVSRVYAGDGRLIGEFASEKRIFVPFERMPKMVINAFVAAEDQRFFSHGGVDFMGLARAAMTNARAYVSGTNRRLVGGSTITQQVAKNFLLSSEKTFERKIKEMILAFRIERAFTKEQILELYLNEINLGGTAYGVAAASQVYFRKSLSELTVAEAALLAGMPQAPTRYNPLINPDLALRRRNYVIRRMLDEKYITQEQADAALKTKIEVFKRQPSTLVGNYFVEEVRREMLEKYGDKKMARGGYVVRSTLDPRLQAAADKALQGGLLAFDRRHGWRGPVKNINDGTKAWANDWKKKLAKVEPPAGHGDWPLALVLEVTPKEAKLGFADGKRGTIPLSELGWARQQKEFKRPGRPDMRTAVGPRPRKVEDVLKQGDIVLVEKVEKDAKGKAYPNDTYTLRQVPDVTGALVAMDPHTGRVLAMSGGYSFWVSQFNNVTQAKRQPGSSFKPIVYLAGLDSGYTPSTIILDAPVVLKIEGWGKYKPRNYSGKFYGPTTMRRGLELSRNLMTVRLAQRTGLDKVSEYGVKLGIADKLPPELAMALGAYETTPFKMAAAYSMIVNGGKKVVPTLVDRIQDRRGKTIFRHDPRNCRKCTGVEWKQQDMPKLPDEREQIADARSAFQIVSMLQGVVQRGTGTAVAKVGKPLAGKTGTTNDTLDAWFVGFSPDLVVAVWVGFDKPRSLGPREQGGFTSAPIFRDFMMEALKDKPATPFRVPKGLVTVPVNLNTGLPARGGDKRVIYEYFKAGKEPTARGAQGPDGVQNYTGFRRNPLAGTGETY